MTHLERYVSHVMKGRPMLGEYRQLALCFEAFGCAYAAVNLLPRAIGDQDRRCWDAEFAADLGYGHHGVASCLQDLNTFLQFLLRFVFCRSMKLRKAGERYSDVLAAHS